MINNKNSVICGIYKIENKINKKIYIGSSNNITYRWKQHINCCKRGKHRNKHFQNAWDKYGKENFLFSIEEECLEEDLLNKEFFYICKYDSLNQKFGYNKQNPLDYPIDIKPKIEKSFILKTPTGEIIECTNITEFAKQNNLDASYLSKVINGKALTCKGYTLPDYIPKEKQIKKYKRSEEWRLKISKGLKGISHTKERANKKAKPFKVKSPDGIVYEGINLTQFAKDHNLEPTLMGYLRTGKRKTHKGWTYIHE